MPKVEIVQSLIKQILKTFSKSESDKVLDLIENLEQNPHKGKLIGTVGGIAIKEIKYKKFRFYCICDGHKLRTLNEEKLVDLLFRFVRMSEKSDQQKVIDEIRGILLKIGPAGL
jgi:hypothetical protein